MSLALTFTQPEEENIYPSPRKKPWGASEHGATPCSDTTATRHDVCPWRMEHKNSQVLSKTKGPDEDVGHAEGSENFGVCYLY